MGKPVDVIQSVRLDDENDTLILLDQTVLPNEKNFLHLKELKDIWEAVNQNLITVSK